MPYMRIIGVVSALALMAACAKTDGVFYTPPMGSTTGSKTVLLGADDSVEAVAQTLTSLGLTVTSQNANSVIARGNGASTGLVDCGKFRQVAFGNQSNFDGASERAVLYTSFDPPDLIVRQSMVASSVRVTLDDGTTVVEERHEISMVWNDGLGRQIGGNRALLRSGTTEKFADGSRCSTTGQVSMSLR